MRRQVLGALAVTAIGAVVGAIALLLAFNRGQELRFEMDRSLPRGMATGLHAPERAGQETFAWTAAHAELTIVGLTRSFPWGCAVRVRGGRGEPQPQPDVDVLIDGLRLHTVAATNEYQEVQVVAPARGRAGLTLGIASSTTVVPGPQDRRELGVQIDRIVCRPAAGGLLWPPRAALGAAATSGAAFAAAVVLAGATWPAGVLTAALLGAAQSWPLSTGLGPYGEYPDLLVRLSLVLALLGAGAVRLLDRATRRPLTAAARFVVLFSACVLYVKLAAILHPSKLVIDALFHAHRFQAVLAGNYYFTQQMPGGVSFPYAIALYLFASPWASLTRDHIALLRIVVSATEVVAGALLYVAVARTWGDRRAGALAVVCFHLVPLPYGLIGNANMTNAFGQSAALAALIVAARFRPDRAWQVAGLFAIASSAFLAHISTAAILGVTLVSAALLCWTAGGPALHRTAWVLLTTTISAAVFAIAVYYGHFPEVYRTLERVRPASAAIDAGETARLAVEEAGARSPTPLVTRAADALYLSGVITGWPLVLLAAAGLWRVARDWTADRLRLMLLAWAVAYVTFFGIGILPRVDVQFERYAAEFVGRVVFATYPAIAVLAAAAVAWASRSGVLPRLAAAALLAWAAHGAVGSWSEWFLR